MSTLNTIGTAFSTPVLNTVNTYVGGIPSSMIGYDSGKEIFNTYENIYDTSDKASLQIATLQTQIIDLQKQVFSLQLSKITATDIEASNKIANGDFTQWTMCNPVVGTINAGGNNTGFIMQGRAIPIADRWYHIANTAAFNASNLKIEVSRVNLSGYLGPTPTPGTVPLSTSYGMKVKYSNATNTSPVFSSIENANTTKYGGILGVQTCVPGIRSFQSGTRGTLGFWLYSSVPTTGFIRFLRQYNTTQKSGLPVETVFETSFNAVSGWKYNIVHATFPNLNLAKTLVDGQDALVIQIGPVHYRWADPGGAAYSTPTSYGDYAPFTQTNPGLEWVLAEVQFRTDTSEPLATLFPVYSREEERCQRYCTYAATQHPQTYAYVANAPKELALGSSRYLPEKDFDFIHSSWRIPMGSKLIVPPSIVILNYRTGSSVYASNAAILFNATTEMYNDDSSNLRDMWGVADIKSMLIDSHLNINYFNGAEVVHDPLNNDPLGTKTGPLRYDMQIYSKTDREIALRGAFNIAEYIGPTFAYRFEDAAVPIDTKLIVNDSSVWAWFTCIVAEVDIGLRQSQAEATAVEPENSAQTTLP